MRAGAEPAARASRVNFPEHDPEKCSPVFGKDHAPAKKIERNDDSKKSHPALGRDAPASERAAPREISARAIGQSFARYLVGREVVGLTPVGAAMVPRGFGRRSAREQSRRHRSEDHQSSHHVLPVRFVAAMSKRLYISRSVSHHAAWAVPMALMVPPPAHRTMTTSRMGVNGRTSGWSRTRQYATRSSSTAWHLPPPAK
jgi:hypothetical protein